MAAARARLGRVLGSLALLAVLLAPAARAVPGPLDILSLPADVDLALCVRDAADASRHPSGWAARQMADELSESLGLPGAWNELWKSLDLPADQAIDRLLGERVLLAVRWPDGVEPAIHGSRAQAAATRAGHLAPPDPDWVVISLVSEDTERRVRHRLRPAPRDVEAGQAILSLEDGRFLLTTRVLDDTRRRGGDRLAILMLAPAANVGLFKEMLPHLSDRGPGPTLRDDPHLARLERLLDADIALLSLGAAPDADAVPRAGVPADRDAAAQPAAHDAAERRAVPPAAREITAIGAQWRDAEDLETHGPGLSARIARLGPSVPREADKDAGLAPGQIDSLAPASLLAVCDMLPLARPAVGEPPELALGVPRGPGVGSLIAAVLTLLDLPVEQLWANVGPETIAVVQGDGSRGVPLALTLGVAVRDLSVVAPSADRLMATLLAAPTLTGPSTPGPDFRGAYPPAVRTAAIPLGAPAHLGGLLGDAPSVSWQFAPMDGAAWWNTPERDDAALAGDVAAPARVADIGDQALRATDGAMIPVAGNRKPANAARAQDGDAPSPWALSGWWVARLSQDPDAGAPHPLSNPSSDPLRAIAGALTAPQTSRGILTAGVARPALALAALAAVEVPIPVATRAIRWVDRVRWEGRLSEPGLLMIDLTIDLDPTKGATPP